ncbi:TIGR03617 family F420-dependent LLM class oxidoreductase [Pseudonocardia sp. GCM10023141]|uniref:TIGR03617 family F420-dependent LLM class oxidoreductase n=1 Tax=Pseudonocardia sp. GCM10023141 TaxID=3252653 RepID=UPI003608903C
MIIDTVFDPAAEPGAAAEVERAGFTGAWVIESVRDPFIVLARAADATRSIELGTGVAIAFARSPMTLAQSAHDVHRLSGGRLLLGLGSQVRPHITRRFGMPWSQPAARMREYVLALRAIWAAWNDGVPLDFRGDFYSHTLMTPTFDPGPSGFGAPPVLLGGVGRRMTAVAGEVADGFLCGPLTTVESFRTHTLPALEAGRARSDRPDFTVAGMPLVVTGVDAATTDRVAAATRKRIAFYASTPAYRLVLEVHGWGGLADRLHGMSRDGRWDDMADLVDDDVLDAFAVIAEPGDVAAALRKRWGGLADRLIATFAADPGVEILPQIAGGAAA